MIEIRNLSYWYENTTQPALVEITLEIQEGEFVVLTGPSGCGKSTLALAIGGYLIPQFGGRVEGTLRVNGLDALSSPPYQVAEVVGLVQQNPENQFCTLTVADEIAFGLENRCLPPKRIQEKLSWALEIVHASHLRDRPLSTLSGGEKQKIAIASMLVADPRVLIFDEPTSNLDPTATAAIFKVLDTIRRELAITIIVIEHKLGFLRRFHPRLIRMEGGRIIEDAGQIPPAQPPTFRQPAPAGPILASTQRLGHHYGPQQALEGIDLTLHGGQLVAVMGDNGSGKTTLLRSLMGLLQPSTGEVWVLGREMRQWRVSELARHVGYLFQNPDHQLLANTVWDEAILLGRNLQMLKEVIPRAEHLLQKTGLGSRRTSHPFQLSYGEKRRLNFISVTAHKPQIVLADEVLIGQDPQNAAYLMEFLRSIADEGGSVLLALHDPQVALRYADRVLFLAQGKLLFDAPPQKAFQTLAQLGYAAYLEGVKGSA